MDLYHKGYEIADHTVRCGPAAVPNLHAGAAGCVAGPDPMDGCMLKAVLAAACVTYPHPLCSFVCQCMQPQQRARQAVQRGGG